jgi:hypothetical protein
MIEPESHKNLKKEISKRVGEDREFLNGLREEVRPLLQNVRRIQPRVTTAISLVGTDGGNNKIQFDPFLVQLIRVVDSSNNEYVLEAITPNTKIKELSRAQFDSAGNPKTSLGNMMSYLGVSQLNELSHMIRAKDDGSPKSPSWIQVYRELVEWAILFSILREKDFGTDTLIVFDGFLRSKVFSGDLFNKVMKGLEEGIKRHETKNKRKIYLVGFAKHSKVLARYRLAMALEGILTTDYPCYLEVPRKLEENVYVWSEYARGDDQEMQGGEINKFVAGKMFLSKFGSGRRDPIWPIDIFQPQTANAPTILGYLLADAINGFPVPFYPLCLQRAHENAALVDFDFDILQDGIFESIRSILGKDSPVLDIYRLQDQDPANLRYQ